QEREEQCRNRRTSVFRNDLHVLRVQLLYFFFRIGDGQPNRKTVYRAAIDWNRIPEVTNDRSAALNLCCGDVIRFELLTILRIADRRSSVSRTRRLCAKGTGKARYQNPERQGLGELSPVFRSFRFLIDR